MNRDDADPRSHPTPPGLPDARDLLHRFAEFRFQTVVSSITDYAVFMLDPHGNVATWNAGAERIKGYRAAEIVGQHFSRFYPPTRSRRAGRRTGSTGRPRRAASKTRAGACARTARSSGRA